MNRFIKSKKIETYDTTLRDGAQDPRSRSSVEKKLKIASLLQDFGFDYIEGGWPGANEVDTEFFRRAGKIFKKNKLVAFGMTIKNTQVEKDVGLKKLLESGTSIITLVGKTWKQNVERTIRIPGQQNLDNIYESIRFLVAQGREVLFDAEHWFDSYRQNKNYAFKTLEAALAGRASRLILCDTRGAGTDRFIFEATAAAIARFPEARFGIHVHNDGGLAVINTIRAVEAGAIHVQGTMNGIGERVGNLDWYSFLSTAQFKYAIEMGLDLTKLTGFAHTVALISGIPVPINAPYVGLYAFAHKGGLHASGQRRDREAYEHIKPECVGNKRVYVFSEQGGSAHLEFMLKDHGYTLNRKNPKFRALLGKMKQYQCFGRAQETLFLYENMEGGLMPFTILDGSGVEDFSPLPPKAYVNVQVNGDKYHKEAIGDGPINAFDIALKKALSAKYPEVNEIRLLGYGVSLPNGDPSTAAEVEVCIKVEFDGEEITSVVRDTNQQRAGEKALADAYNCCIIEN
ncbi:MAG: alpha-isopropylmalate synthase regulatory domain-containing protein [Candidatus Daviesbacteria bacterium]|nr:alpha-isopropylmalate synthase regulatory domain-containing protein [Candidatus Daviesbacteria bacterium]